MLNFKSPGLDDERTDLVKTFVIDKVIPYEQDSRNSHHGPNDELRLELNQLAREAGVLSPQASKIYGGWGFSHVEQVAVFEAVDERSKWATKMSVSTITRCTVR